MSVGVWPMLMALITDEWRNKRAISRDVEDRLYSKAIYIFTKVKQCGCRSTGISERRQFLFSSQTFYSMPTSGGIFLAYIVPGYLLAGIHYKEVMSRDFDLFYLHIGNKIVGSDII